MCFHSLDHKFLTQNSKQTYPHFFQWSHQGHGGFNEVNVEEFMKTESGMDNMDYLYHTGGQGAGQNVSPTMAHLPPPPHTPGSRPGDGGQYHHNLSNWVR